MSEKVLNKNNIADFFSDYTVQFHRFRLEGVRAFHDGQVYGVLKETSSLDAGTGNLVFVTSDSIGAAIDYIQTMEGSGSTPLQKRMLESAKPKMVESLSGIKTDIEAFEAGCTQHALDESVRGYDALFSFARLDDTEAVDGLKSTVTAMFNLLSERPRGLLSKLKPLGEEFKKQALGLGIAPQNNSLRSNLHLDDMQEELGRLDRLLNNGNMQLYDTKRDVISRVEQISYMLGQP